MPGTGQRLGLKPTSLEAGMAKLGVNRPGSTSENWFIREVCPFER
jgi:hypothetical protein